MEQKKTGGLSKVMKLIAVLQKCSGKASIIKNDEALISPAAAKAMVYLGLLLLTGALAFAAYYFQPVIAAFASLENLVQTVMMLILVMSFALAIKDIVTVLYTADDLPLLLPMPFSPNQIVMAKLAVAGRFPVILSFVVMNSLCLGLGIRAGAGVPFIIGTVLSSILLPVTGIALATLLIVVPFRLFGFIRNRDIIMVFGGVLSLALLFGYTYMNQKLRNGVGSQAAEAVSAVAGIAASLPNIAFMSRFMFGGNYTDLLISVGISAVIFVLSLLAVRLFYLSTALAMQNTSTKRKAVTKDVLGSGKKTSAVKALTAYESKNTRRNPAYLIYGFAMSFLWPALFLLPIVLSDDSLMAGMVFPLSTGTALLAAVLLGVMSASFVCSFNILPVTAFSREGDTFTMIRTMPIDFRDYFRSKRNFSMRIYTLGSVLYVVILGIVCLVLGVIKPASCWVILVGAAVSYFADLIFVNCLLLKDSRKPYFTWDTETEISRKLCWINIVAIIIGMITMAVFFIVIGMMGASEAGTAQVPWVLIGSCAAVVIVILLVSLILNSYAEKKGAERLLNYQ